MNTSWEFQHQFTGLLLVVIGMDGSAQLWLTSTSHLICDLCVTTPNQDCDSRHMLPNSVFNKAILAPTLEIASATFSQNQHHGWICISVIIMAFTNHILICSFWTCTQVVAVQDCDVHVMCQHTVHVLWTRGWRIHVDRKLHGYIEFVISYSCIVFGLAHTRPKLYLWHSLLILLTLWKVLPQNVWSTHVEIVVSKKNNIQLQVFNYVLLLLTTISVMRFLY